MVVGGGEAGAGGGPAVGQQPQRDGVGQRLDGPQALAGDAEGFAAGGEDPDAGAARQDLGGEFGGGADDVLAVVQEQQEAAARAVVGEPVEGAVAGPAGERPQLLGGGAAQLGLPRPERGEDGVGDVLRVVHGRQLHEPHPVGPAGGVLCLGGLLGEPGLPGPAGPEQRHEPGPREVLPDDADVVFAPDEGGEAGPQVPGRQAPAGRGAVGGVVGRRGRQTRAGRVVRVGGVVRVGRGGGRGGRGQEGGVQGAQGGARVGAEAAGQLPAERVVGGQRLRRAAGVAQGADAEGVERLVQGGGRAQRGQLRERGLRLPEVEGGGEPAPARLRPQCLPPGGLRRPVRQRGQRRPAPQGEPLVVQGGRLGRVGGLGGRPGEAFEAVQVDVLPVGGQGVPALPGAHGRLPERPPQPGHQRLQRGHGVRGRVAVPYVGDERAHRHRPPRPQRERGQQRPQACSADGDGGAVVADGLGGAENRVAHRPILPDPGPGPSGTRDRFAAWVIRAAAASGVSVRYSSASSR
ncbi:hypothetical protein EES37_02215 [Streptomyces sp. ADI91-18]|nr:hypothetical protein EES37_02215 [Streptomyces sp. ADI91-18]